MATLGPVGSAIYTNQQMALVAGEKNALHNRFELQNLAANSSANAKQKEVEELRPAEEAHMIDPDREHTKKENDRKMGKEEGQEEGRGSEGSQEEQTERSDDAPLRHLDIKV